MTAKPLNEGKCWAEPLGGCGGPITREFLATESLFQSKVRVRGGIHGAEGTETSIRKLTANVFLPRPQQRTWPDGGRSGPPVVPALPV